MRNSTEFYAFIDKTKYKDIITTIITIASLLDYHVGVTCNPDHPSTVNQIWYILIYKLGLLRVQITFHFDPNEVIYKHEIRDIRDNLNGESIIRLKPREFMQSLKYVLGQL